MYFLNQRELSISFILVFSRNATQKKLMVSMASVLIGLGERSSSWLVAEEDSLGDWGGATAAGLDFLVDSHSQLLQE